MVIDNFNRKVLSEGRNYGFGFTFLKKTDAIITAETIVDPYYETLMPFTACRDYLNDFVYIETLNKSLNTVYGFKHEYKGIFKDQEYFYLGINSLHFKNGKEWEGKENLSKIISNNYNNLIKLLNKLEETFQLETFTKFEYLENDILILKVPIFWSKFNFLISLYTFYIRCFINITEEELNTIPFNELVKKEPYLKEDVMLLKGIIRWMEFLPDLLDYKYPENPDSYNIHNFGISARVNEFIMKENKKKLAIA